jgi:hypothetical protein
VPFDEEDDLVASVKGSYHNSMDVVAGCVLYVPLGWSKSWCVTDTHLECDMQGGDEEGLRMHCGWQER